MVRSHEALRRCPNCPLRLMRESIDKTLKFRPPAQPFTRWAIDFTGPMTFNDNRRLILVAIH